MQNGKFNIQPVLDGIKNALLEAAKEKRAIVDNTLTDYTVAAELRLANLATQRLAGEVDNQFVLDRLADEKEILKAELISFEVMAEAELAGVITTALNILIEAINAQLPEDTEKIVS